MLAARYVDGLYDGYPDAGIPVYPQCCGILTELPSPYERRSLQARFGKQVYPTNQAEKENPEKESKESRWVALSGQGINGLIFIGYKKMALNRYEYIVNFLL